MASHGAGHRLPADWGLSLIHIYIELRADGTGETYMEDFVTFQWKDGNFYALTDPNTPAMTYTREGDLLTIEFDGMTMVFKRSDTKPEICLLYTSSRLEIHRTQGWQKTE